MSEPVFQISLINSKTWLLDGVYHCLNGPAYEYENGSKEWWVYGKLHREDGPAIEYADGSKRWYFRGTPINVGSQEEFEFTLPLLQIAELIDE
jgi:hypothetical protein